MDGVITGAYRLKVMTGTFTYRANGNYEITNLPSGAIPVMVKVTSGSYYNFAIIYDNSYSAWMVHAMEWSHGDAKGDATITTGLIYYFE